MSRIDRRDFMKVTGAGGFALSVGAAHNLLTANEVRAQERSAIWPNRRLLDLLRVEHPIIQAPMGGHVSPDMPVAVSRVGGLGSFPCSSLTPTQVRDEFTKIRAKTLKPINLNFFCHATPQRDEALESAWSQRLAPYYAELGIDPPPAPARPLAPFGAEMCDVVIELKPDVVSFHFGLPDKSLVDRIKAAGCTIFSSATTVTEARWLEDHGADAVIAQGAEAGGHRGMFLTTESASQAGTLVLVPQVVDAGQAVSAVLHADAPPDVGQAALPMGAGLLQRLRWALRRCRWARPTYSARKRASLLSTGQPSSRHEKNVTAITNVLTGRPARVFVNRIVRELGPLATGVPSFPLPAAALASLRTKAESSGSSDFSALYAGQGASLARELPAGELTLKLAAEAREHV